jgi:hypothetical protein
MFLWKDLDLRRDETQWGLSNVVCCVLKHSIHHLSWILIWNWRSEKGGVVVCGWCSFSEMTNLIRIPDEARVIFDRNRVKEKNHAHDKTYPATLLRLWIVMASNECEQQQKNNERRWEDVSNLLMTLMASKFCWAGAMLSRGRRIGHFKNVNLVQRACISQGLWCI